MRFLEGLTSVRTAAILPSALTIWVVATTHTASYATGSPPATPKASVVQIAIAQLEDKLYEHKYPAETDDARLTRIEKFVFGAAQTGTTAERLQRLQTSIASQADAIDKPPSLASQPTAAPAAVG